jgi:hypothetical protein
MRRHTARTTRTRTMPRLEALDDRALPSGMAGAQMMAIEEHRAALQQQRELRLEAQQQKHELRLEALQQRRELRLEALQQRRASNGHATSAASFQFQFQPQSQVAMPSDSAPTSLPMAPATGTGSAATAPIATTPAAAPVAATPVAMPSASMSSPVMDPAMTMMGSSPSTATTPTTPAPAPQPVPNADPHLNAAYEDFLASNGGNFSTSQAGIIEVVGTSVGVDVHGQDAAVLATELSGLGMTVQNVNAANGVVEGLLPLAELPTAANTAGVIGISAIYVPKLGMAL